MTELSPSPPAAVSGGATLRDLRVFRGPNLWSLRPVVSCDLDLTSLTASPDRSLLGRRVREALRHVRELECSSASCADPADLDRNEADIPHFVKEIALGLQRLAGAAVSFGLVERASRRDVWRISMEYEEETTGLESVHIAVGVVNGFFEARQLPLESVVGRMGRRLAEARHDPYAAAIIGTATQRRIPVYQRRLDSTIVLGLGRFTHRIQGCRLGANGAMAAELAVDAGIAQRILSRSNVPVRLKRPVHTVEQAVKTAQSLGYPVRLEIRTPSGHCERSAYVDREESLRGAWPDERCQVWIEGRALGREYQLIAIGPRTATACAARCDSALTGETRHHSVGQPPDGLTKSYTEDAGSPHRDLSTHSMPPEEVPPSRPGGRTAGVGVSLACGTAPRGVHPENHAASELAVAALGLRRAKVHWRSLDLSIPWFTNGAAIVDVSPLPDFVVPDKSLNPAALASEVLDTIYPPGTTTSIPIVAVTGTNGKTTTARLITHLLRQRYGPVGLKTTDGVYVGQRTLMEGDIVSAVAARALLHRSDVGAAVLETARGGILSHGLGFERATVGVVLNVAEDHLDLGGVHTLEDLARLKSVVVRATRRGGWAILNADDPRVYAMRKTTPANVALITVTSGMTGVVATHVARNGLALCQDDSHYVLRHGSRHLRVVPIRDVPLSLGGAATFQHQNILAAIATAYVLGVRLQTIRAQLLSFRPSPAMLPGRMNLFEAHGVSILVDYAHNPHAMAGLMELVRVLPATRRLGVLSMPGDRRDEDIRAFAALADGLDRVIVKENADLRGRAPGDVSGLMTAELRKGPTDDKHVSVILPERAAVRQALSEAQPGELVVISANQVSAVIQLVHSFISDPKAST